MSEETAGTVDGCVVRGSACLRGLCDSTDRRKLAGSTNGLYFAAERGLRASMDGGGARWRR